MSKSSGEECRNCECEESNAWSEGLGCAVIILALGLAIAAIVIAVNLTYHGK